MAQISNSAVMGGTIGTHLDTSSMTMQMEKSSGIPCKHSNYDDFITGEHVRQIVFDDVIMVEERLSTMDQSFNRRRKVTLHIKAFDAPIQIALFDSEFVHNNVTVDEHYTQRAIAEKLRDYAAEQLAKLELEK